MLDLTLLQLKVLWEISKKPKCGYELMNLGKKKITQGTMYPLLQSMERFGILETKPGKTRGKKFYHVTPKGHQVLKDACKRLCAVYREIFKEYVCTRCKK